MKKDDTVYLRHILDALNLVEEYTHEMSENEFLSNSMAHDAIIRQIEIIGEAAKNIPDDFRAAHPKLPWGKMTGIRNKMILEYFNVNLAIVWDTVQDDLPVLQKIIKSMLV